MEMQATWNGVVLASSADTVVVEGNHYFPAEAVNQTYFSGSDTHSHCPWKGDASYYSVTVDGKTNTDAAWYYPEPLPEALMVAGRVAFWKGVEVTEVA
ncbi:MAG: hypothetical protein JWP74_2651 [Marmoricola sp.]|nr:hypothetical protein [Marmoricola sp.]